MQTSEPAGGSCLALRQSFLRSEILYEKICFGIILLLFLAAPAAFGRIYEYTDRHGNRVMTDSPPSGVQAREKKMSDEGVYWSNQSGSYQPSSDGQDKTGVSPTQEEKQKKRYDRVSRRYVHDRLVRLLQEGA